MSRYIAWFVLLGLLFVQVAVAQDDGTVTGQIVIGDDDRGQITATTAAPYSGVVQILVSNSWCSGTLIHQSYVMTAGHCVVDKNGVEVSSSSITVIAARSGTTFPYGTRSVSQFWVTDEWVLNEDFGWDFAVLQLSAPYDSEEHTIFNLNDAADSYLNDTNRVFGLYGYPADKSFGQMWGMQQAGLDGNTNPSNILPAVLEYKLDTFGGQSGSGLWALNDEGGYDIVGIHSYGDAPRSVNGAARVRSEMFDRLDVWGIPYNGIDRQFNDTPATATDISTVLPYQAQAITTDAQSDVVTPCNGPIEKDVFYKLTAPYSGNLQVSTSGSSYDTQVAIYDGDPTQGGTLLGCNDDDGGSPQSLFTVGVVAGNEYFVQAGSQGTVGGQLILDVRILPFNDFIANAIDIGNQLPYSTAFSTVGAGKEINTTCTTYIGADVFYRITPDFTGRLRVTTFGSDFDTQLAVFDGVPGDGGKQITCNDDNSGIQSSALFDVVAQTTYYIQLGGYADASGNLTVNIERLIPPVNDAPDDAVEITTLTFTDTVGTTSAFTDVETLCGGNFIGQDVFYKLTPTIPGDLTVDTFGSDFDTQIAIFNSTPTQLICNDDVNLGKQSELTLTLTASATYYIQAGGWRDSNGNLILNTVFVPNFPEDVNQDGAVTPADMVYVVNRVGGSDENADVNGDNVVDETDVSLVGAALGSSVP